MNLKQRRVDDLDHRPCTGGEIDAAAPALSLGAPLEVTQRFELPNDMIGRLRRHANRRARSDGLTPSGGGKPKTARWAGCKSVNPADLRSASIRARTDVGCEPNALHNGPDIQPIVWLRTLSPAVSVNARQIAGRHQKFINVAEADLAPHRRPCRCRLRIV